ncbi:MAG TPA: CBS domain-containing protein [Tepidisphaeraceae bacterium]|jgi:CBS domain-containing protein|nr:CBS domain-containing protein [Tepidisphaeraceae bacterium]
MTQIQDVLARKGFEVHTIGSCETVLAATQMMSDRRIGGMVVMDDGRIVGMFTERDVLRRVVAARRDPQFTYVGEVMTRDVFHVPPTASLEQVSSVMKAHRVRHVPVVSDEGDLMGIVSMRDLSSYTAEPHRISAYAWGESLVAASA